MSNSGRFHRAARDGYLDLLKEATRKDCNERDELGMTPTLWAAYHGNLDALRLLVSRGGDPDKTDYQGSTALHHAAANAHISCLTFLVQFGCNIWGLDNDYHTPLDVAAVNERMDCVRYLDSVVAQQSKMNVKVVKKLKDKQFKEAEKRIKKFSKMQKEQERRVEKYHVKTEKKLSTSEEKGPGVPGGPHRRNFHPNTHMNFSEATALSKKKGIPKKIADKRKQSDSAAVFKVSSIEDGKRSLRSLSGTMLQDQNVLLGNPVSAKGQRSTDPDMSDEEDDDSVSRAVSEPNFNYRDGSDTQSTILDRPGFGNIVFRQNYPTAAMFSLPAGQQNGGKDTDQVDRLDSITTILAAQEAYDQDQNTGMGNNGTGLPSDRPWEDDGLDDLDLDEDELNGNASSPLQLFLSIHNLAEYLPVFNREQIDLEALMLCTDEDLKSINLPLGPRKKLMDSVTRRKAVLHEPGSLEDTAL
ncbi:PREDICTED: Usher syndrome type-1G protein homolog isoform X2 [Branchiostoma belcheri]|uniref:Usher syndrome type-1G protein homolog isoform X1 n=1 Tax=Branchiostoma belcheri TaxID=7741 RepID=A0A6P4XM86_BRABE|nr:PREDICTED: Usher syndrome type-1G protein homolog isoform X1 [Branchiostoma belcheri]XP_019617735.1 PREDICTED: Usher syndrome type-1G protein homolog isoform X1 [Branchiostoma belcheri]XP_019617736.1 PREDICTED: Usher syndrome type-1G protein homolog isoform X2 [Branchiostoma belcheri]